MSEHIIRIKHKKCKTSPTHERLFYLKNPARLLCKTQSTVNSYCNYKHTEVSWYRPHEHLYWMCPDTPREGVVFPTCMTELLGLRMRGSARRRPPTKTSPGVVHSAVFVRAVDDFGPSGRSLLLSFLPFIPRHPPSPYFYKLLVRGLERSKQIEGWLV